MEAQFKVKKKINARDTIKVQHFFSGEINFFFFPPYLVSRG
jgi:hypothetical protein